MSLRTFLVSGEDTILREIAEPKLKRKDIAMTYRLIMDGGEEVNWGWINKAILGRWKLSGLIWIKKQAHSGKCFAVDAK